MMTTDSVRYVRERQKGGDSTAVPPMVVQRDAWEKNKRSASQAARGAQARSALLAALRSLRDGRPQDRLSSSSGSAWGGCESKCRYSTSSNGRDRTHGLRRIPHDHAGCRLEVRGRRWGRGRRIHRRLRTFEWMSDARFNDTGDG